MDEITVWCDNLTKIADMIKYNNIQKNCLLIRFNLKIQKSFVLP